MPEQVIEETPLETPAAQAPIEAAAPEAPKEDNLNDILKRVTQKTDAKPQEAAGGTFKEFDDIADPIQRQKMIDREKLRIADYTRKTQAVAKEREDLQRQAKEMENWTPEKVQNYLLKNPTFLQAAQAIAQQPQNPAGSGLSDEQFSALTPVEKNQLFEMNRQIGELRQQNFTAAMSQKDAFLQTKYGDYDALKVNEGIGNLSRINPIDIREHVYKAIYHDDHVKAAYEMGKKESQTLNQQRTQAVTTANGINMVPSNGVPKKEKGENDINYFARLAQRRIDEAKASTALRK